MPSPADRRTPADPARPGPPLSLAEGSLRARLLARDERALGELIELATPWLLGLAQAMLRDPDDAEEVVAETFTAVWRNIRRLGEEHEGLMPWLLRIARNRAIDRLRRRSRFRRKAERALAFGGLGEVATAAAEPNEAAHPGWHVHRSVHAALDGLPPEQRAVVRLAYFNGLTHSEIARELDLPIGTVKTRLRLALAKLQVALGPLKDWVL
jgi:RNA polymerase sigma-70 factor (ECF subfamily)